MEFSQHPKTKWLYELRKEKGRTKWLRYGPTPENKKVFNRDAGVPCSAPQNAFRISLYSNSPTTWVIYGTGWQPMPTNTKINTTILGNPIDMFIHRLLGVDYKSTFRGEEKMCKIAAPITCATTLAGLDGSLK